MPSSPILVPIAPGELVDKITILALKLERIPDAGKRLNVQQELELLRTEQARHVPATAELKELEARLKDINGRIWELEDTIRECERSKDFGAVFLATARDIYRTNDRRAATKREINLLLKSPIVEEKSYTDY